MMNYHIHDVPSSISSTRNTSGSGSSTSTTSKVKLVGSYWSSSMSTTTSPPKVIHRYVDHSQDPLLVKKPKDIGEVAQRGAARQFPTKLYDMLIKASSDGSAGGGFEDCVSWQPHGRCFIVRDPKAFVANVMPKFFAQSKLTSFQRQLSLYGFARLTQGKDQGAYYHELFLRGRPDLIDDIVRTRVKGTGCKAPSSPETEPDFYAMKHCSLHPTIPLPTLTSTSSSSSSQQQVPSSGATTVSDIQSSVGCDPESSKDDESTAMSDALDEYLVGGSTTHNSVEGVYTHGAPFIASMELFLPRSFQEAAAAGAMPELSGPAGPLSLPGRLRNTVMQHDNGTTSVVKFIPMNLSQMMKARETQWSRWAAALKNDISTKLLSDEESGWNGSTCTSAPSTAPAMPLAELPEPMTASSPCSQVEVRSHAALLPALPAACGQAGGPTLEDIIYMI